MVAVGARPDVARVTPQRKLRFHFHDGQTRAFWSDARITLVLAGTQSGKTTIGPPWLFRQIKLRGPGDYFIVSPTYSLMRNKVLPEFLRLFHDHLQLGPYISNPGPPFRISPAGEIKLFGAPQQTRTRVLFGYGENPDSLESATAKAAWLDEAGQKSFKRDSFDAVMRRLSIEQGPVLVTTTPYFLGWLKEMHDHAGDPLSGVEVINFRSIDNPTFSQDEWERAKRTLPEWKFRMFYMGLFERPAGLIYDCFDEKRHVVPWFAIPDDWPRFFGLDFGGVNTAAIGVAKELGTNGKPTDRYVAYREYLAGGRTAKQHGEHILVGEPRRPTTIGGSKSEGQWRAEFAAGGLGIEPPPISDVEVGIQRVYGMLKNDELVVMDSLTGLLDELRGYSRVLDERGEPTEDIEDKSTYHRLDGLRYVCAHLVEGSPRALPAGIPQASGWIRDRRYDGGRW